MSKINEKLVEITFKKATSFSSNVLGYGTIKNNGIGIFYTLYLSDKTSTGIVVSLPSRKKADGTFDNQAYFLDRETKELFETAILKEVAKQGIAVKPAKPVHARVVETEIKIQENLVEESFDNNFPF